ncbi:MAG: fumarylacetoacetate hydrolase family protein [Solirubrobacterales bacterium]
MLDVGRALKQPAALDIDGLSALPRLLGDSLSGDWRPLIDGWDELRDPLAELLERTGNGDLGGALHELDDDVLAAPLPSPTSRIFALGGNFDKHIQDASRVALGIDDDLSAALARRRAQGPWGFIVLPDTLAGPGTEIRAPEGIQKVDYEGEVAVILGAGGRALDAAELQVWGFSAFNDFSLRDTAFQLGEPYDAGPMAWSLQKNFDTGSSIGPWVVVDEPFDVDQIDISLRVNGELRQRGNTKEMIFTFGETFEHLSRFLTLKSGDILASGTPSGTALETGLDGPFLDVGDVTELEVEGVGVLRNVVAASV